MSNTAPVILCHGLFGWGPDELAGFPYWGLGLRVPSPLRRFAASVGPISSTHDRACELAYQIRGGTVDYGQEHSDEAGHARFGRSYPQVLAYHPGWSEASPVHLVGHSMGAPTIWWLQQLLAEDFFGWGSSADWIRSVTSISGVLNGSTATYYLGASEETGRIAPGRAADYMSRGIELSIRLTGDLFDRFYDFDLDHWGIDSDPAITMHDRIGRIARSPLFSGTDNAAFSLSIQGLLRQNALSQTHPNTYYLSFVTAQTFGGFLSGHHYPEIQMNPFAIPTAIYIGQANFDRPFYPDFKASDWWHNDGLVSVFSQQFPRIAGSHPVGGELAEADTLHPGRWYHQMLDGVDHIDIVAMPQGDQIGKQLRFYKQLFEGLAAL